MAGYTYVNKGYNYTDVPAHGGGYVYEPEHGNWYVVETTTVERFCVPVVGYTQFGGVPIDHLEGYERAYGSEYANSSPPRYHEQQNPMTKFLNKTYIGASRPTKTSDNSIPNKYRPKSPDKYRSTSPKNYHTTSPNKYRPTSPDKYLPTSPDKYRPTNPNKYRTTSLNKYPSTSLTHNYPSNEAHLINGQTLPVPNDNYRPTSPTKYQPTSPKSSHSLKEDGRIKGQNLPSPNKYQPTNPVHSFPSKEGQAIKAQSFLGPNKQQPSRPRTEGGRHVRVLDFSGPNNHRQNEAPRATHHTLSNPTNNIDEALSLLAVSANYSPRGDPNNREGAFDNMSPHARPVEHERRYPRPTFGGGNTCYTGSNTIDSHEAKKRYNGAYVP